jgi:DNA transposition AAA+ family ATPase
MSEHAARWAESKELRKLLIDADLRQADMARRLDINPVTLSAYLKCTKRWPQDFPARFRAAVDL